MMNASPLSSAKWDEWSVQIEAILRFHLDLAPKTLEEIGFEFKVSTSFSHIFFFPQIQTVNAPIPSPTMSEESPEPEVQRERRRSRRESDDSWMPSGWRKVETRRALDRGRFAGYVDKKYYAPGVRRAFRSKSEALRYLNSLGNGNDGAGTSN